MDLKSLLVTMLCLCVTAERDCDEIGMSECVLLSECKPLMSMLTTSRRDMAVFDKLREYNCGYEDNDPMVCCPSPDINLFVDIVNGKDCMTPGGEKGTCTELKSCGYMYEKVKNTGFVSTENMDLIRKSKCTAPGSSTSSYVCCKSSTDNRFSSPPPTSDELDDNKCLLTAFPPKLGSDCCGIESSSDSRIIGGTAASIDQFPWLVMIDYSREGFSCGGSLISGRYVLTAAHCLVGSKGKSRGPVSVRLGEYNATNPGRDCVDVAGGGEDCTDGVISVPIESFVVHDEYANEQVLQYHDIALIRLKEIIEYTDFIRPICLPSSDFTINAPDDIKFYISGWGISDEKQQHSSDIKLFAKVPYVKKEQCNERYKRLGRQSLLDSQLCIGGEANRDSCKGDSGGPLMLLKNFTYEAVGVVSFGTKTCGLENWPSIYTKVYDYLDWINANIKP